MNAKKIGLIALFSALILCITTAPAMADDFWVSDPAIVSGVESTSYPSTAPTIFYMDETWYLISGDYHGIFHGNRWTGSEWQQDDSIVSGLVDVGCLSAPHVFYKDATWYLIAGEQDGVFNGYNWTGSGWQQDDAIVSGLGDVNDWSAPTVFYKDATWYLISGDGVGGFHGYNWAGSEWQQDDAIVSGLGVVYDWSAPTVFYKDATWYLISGESAPSSVAGFYGFNWTGSAWQSDPGIVSGLGDVGAQRSKPEVFYKDATWYLVSGRGTGGFRGYQPQKFYRVDVTIEGKRVLPGQNTTSRVRVINTGDMDASYEVTITGTAVGEPTIGVSPLSWNTGNLIPDSEHVTIVNISTTDDTPRQTYTLTATATCDQDTNVTDSDTAKLEVVPPVSADFVVGDQIGDVELFMDSNGSFVSRGVIADVGDLAWGLASGDFNGDAYQDFVVGDYEGQIELFLGHGFSSAGIVTDVGIEAYGLTSGDYDGDGYDDFVVGDGAGELELFKNNGAGAFNTAGIIADIGDHAWALTSCDFSGDDNCDFISGDYDGTLKLFTNDGTGNFTASTIVDLGNDTYGVTSGDYDNDGDCDFLATANDGEVKLFTNDGTGTFTDCGTAISLGAWRYGLESNDFDADGDIDVLGETSDETVNLYKNDGSGNFVYDSVVASPGQKPRGLTSGYFVMPDLTVTQIDTPIVYANVSNVITATIENGGNENAGAFNTTLYADEVEIETKQVSALNADASTTVSFSWTPTHTGSYELRVMADSAGAIEEFSESNNDRTKEVTADEAVLPPTPNIIKYGYVFYANGTECTGPVVNVKNLDSGNEWPAETYNTSHHYELILDSNDKNVSDVLRFTATNPDATQEKVTEYTVTQAELDDGGIFGLNLTLHPVGAEVVNNVTTGDIDVAGTRTGAHENTHTPNDTYESIEEIESKGKPASRYSYLEHKWTIDVISGNKTSVTFHLEANRTNNTEGDDFNFSYSTDDSNYEHLVMVNNAVETIYTCELPNTLSGIVYIRVVDTDQTAGRKTLDTIFIDHIFICSVLGAPDTTPPAKVTGISVTTVSSSQLDVSWTANTESDLDHYNVYRSETSGFTPDASNLIASPTTNSYSDTGLSANTTYYYRVTAVDTSGNEGMPSEEASGTTNEAPTNTMHVASIDMSLSNRTAGKNIFTHATALVTIVNATGAPVEGATVHGYWSNATSDTDSGVTDSTGQVSLDSDEVKSASGKTFTFTVDDVAKTGWAWDCVQKSNSTTVP